MRFSRRPNLKTFPPSIFDGDAGWSKGGQGVIDVIITGPTSNKHTLQYYVRQRLLSESVFHWLSSVTQERLCDVCSRYKEQTLQYISSLAGQERVTTKWKWQIFRAHIVRNVRRTVSSRSHFCQIRRPFPDQLGEMGEWCWAEVSNARLNNGKSRQQLLDRMLHRHCGHKIKSPACKTTAASLVSKFA